MSSTEVLENPRSAKRRKQRERSASRACSLCCAFFESGARGLSDLPRESLLEVGGLAVELRASRDLVNELLLLAECQAHDGHIRRPVLPHGRAIGFVVSGLKHVFDVERDRN